MATLFGNLPAVGARTQPMSRSGSGGGALVAAVGSERALQWVYDEETANCMHCNTPFTLLTRKVRQLSFDDVVTSRMLGVINALISTFSTTITGWMMYSLRWTCQHHCRRCGNVICHNCSPHKRRISVSDPFVRAHRATLSRPGVVNNT